MSLPNDIAACLVAEMPLGVGERLETFARLLLLILRPSKVSQLARTRLGTAWDVPHGPCRVVCIWRMRQACAVALPAASTPRCRPNGRKWGGWLPSAASDQSPLWVPWPASTWSLGLGDLSCHQKRKPCAQTPGPRSLQRPARAAPRASVRHGNARLCSAAHARRSCIFLSPCCVQVLAWRRGSRASEQKTPVHLAHRQERPATLPWQRSLLSSIIIRVFIMSGLPLLVLPVTCPFGRCRWRRRSHHPDHRAQKSHSPS